MKDLKPIISQFDITGTVNEVKPLGNGLINDTYKVTTIEDDAPDYVLQRINDSIFTDVDLLQHNIEEVTTHIRQQLEKQGADDIDRKVLTFVKASNGKTYVKDEDQQYWRISVFIPRAITQEAVNPESSYYAGKTFGEFEAQLTDITDRLGETIPDFHNMELRRDQLRQAVKEDRAGRAEGVKDFIAEIESYMDEMCLCQRLFREGKLQKRPRCRICYRQRAGRYGYSKREATEPLLYTFLIVCANSGASVTTLILPVWRSSGTGTALVTTTSSMQEFSRRS